MTKLLQCVLALVLVVAQARGEAITTKYYKTSTGVYYGVETYTVKARFHYNSPGNHPVTVRYYPNDPVTTSVQVASVTAFDGYVFTNGSAISSQGGTKNCGVVSVTDNASFFVTNCTPYVITWNLEIAQNTGTNHILWQEIWMEIPDGICIFPATYTAKIKDGSTHRLQLRVDGSPCGSPVVLTGTMAGMLSPQISLPMAPGHDYQWFLDSMEMATGAIPSDRSNPWYAPAFDLNLDVSAPPPAQTGSSSDLGLNPVPPPATPPPATEPTSPPPSGNGGAGTSTLTNGGGGTTTRQDIYDAVKSALDDSGHQSAKPKWSPDPVDTTTVDDTLKVRGGLDTAESKLGSLFDLHTQLQGKFTSKMQNFASSINGLSAGIGKCPGIDCGSLTIAGQTKALFLSFELPGIAPARAAVGAAIYVYFFFIMYQTIRKYM